MAANKAERRGRGRRGPLGQTTLSRYWRPRHWPYWLFWLWMRITAALPFRWALSLHKAIGRLVYRHRDEARIRRAPQSSRSAFPSCPRPRSKCSSELQFESIGASVAETAIAWCAPQRKFAGRFAISGLEHLERGARARPRRDFVYRTFHDARDLRCARSKSSRRCLPICTRRGATGCSTRSSTAAAAAARTSRF